MSGHSKWSTIKHKKAIKDQKRGAIFSRLSKEISTVARENGSDPSKNPRLRMVLQKARDSNMPSANIKRAIERGSIGKKGRGISDIVYEGYGPGGIAVVAIVKTDNRQRTSAELKHIFDQFGGSIGEPGSAMFLFEKEGDKFVSKMKIPLEEQDVKDKFDSFIKSLRSHSDVRVAYSNSEIE
jgi:YebC/PmpR family DNA-binding regulatory protein